MLVLARQVHERILIPVIDTSIEVVSARPGLARLGIEAPSAITVLREELHRRCPTTKAPFRTPHPSILQQGLRTVLLGLSRLQEQTGTGNPPALTLSFEQVMDELARLLREVTPRGELRGEAIDSA